MKGNLAFLLDAEFFVILVFKTKEVGVKISNESRKTVDFNQPTG